MAPSARPQSTSRRHQIELTDDELAAFLDDQRTVICATNGRGGWPHLMPLWYVIRDGDIWAWTYARSQKVRNLERDPRATLQVETGDSYDQLRGVMLEVDAVLHREAGVVAQVGAELAGRYGGDSPGPEAMEAIRGQAAKRVALHFRPRRVSSWDHRKLGGAY